MRMLRLIAPASIVAVLALVAALPWGLRADYRFFLPLLPYIAVFYWSVRQPDSMPGALAVACGLTLDVLTYGPLGFWGLIYIIGWLAAQQAAGALAQRAVARWLAFGLAAASLAALAWALSSVYIGVLEAWQPFAIAAAAAMLTYPPVAVLCAVFAEPDPRPQPMRLERGT